MSSTCAVAAPWSSPASGGAIPISSSGHSPRQSRSHACLERNASDSVIATGASLVVGLSDPFLARRPDTLDSTLRRKALRTL